MPGVKSATPIIALTLGNTNTDAVISPELQCKAFICLRREDNRWVQHVLAFHLQI